MKASLTRRVIHLERQQKAHPILSSAPISESLMYETFWPRFYALQERAVRGGLDAGWRVERIGLFFEKARERRNHEHQNSTR